MSDDMDHLDKLNEKVKEYCERYRHPDMEDYSCGPVYDLFPRKTGGSIQCRTQWNDKWPNSDEPGVYVFLDSDGYILYIGKASMGNLIGYRLGSYSRYDEGKNCELVKWLSDSCARYVWTVGVPPNTRFEAPALEEFLLMELKTKLNKQGA